MQFNTANYMTQLYLTSPEVIYFIARSLYLLIPPILPISQPLHLWQSPVCSLYLWTWFLFCFLKIITLNESFYLSVSMICGKKQIFNNYSKYLLPKANSTYTFSPMKDMGPPYF